MHYPRCQVEIPLIDRFAEATDTRLSDLLEKGLAMRKQSPATIIALLALFVALGGVGVAATGDNFILGNPTRQPRWRG